MEYQNCLVELDEILNYLSKEDLMKIPKEIISGIESHKSKEYIWKYDKTKPLMEQQLSRKTIAMLSYINMEYLLNNEEKELIQQIHALNEQKLEKTKQEKYNSNELFNNTKNNNICSEESLINVKNVKEDKWYKKIFYFIKNLLKRKSYY